MMATRITVGNELAAIRCPYRLRWICTDLPTRRWDPSRKRWLIPSSDVPLAVAAFKRAGELVEIRDLRTAQGRPQPEPSSWPSEMFAALPADLRAPAFRALAKVLHPDVGGNTAAMAALTTAYEEAQE